MTRFVIAACLAVIALASTAPAFAANNAPNCSAKSSADFAQCVILQSQRQIY